MNEQKSEDSDEEISQRMEAGIRRALSTPPTPTKELIGKTERALARRESRIRKKAKPEPPAS